MPKVTIGIQARSTSKRFPNKMVEKLGDKLIIEHVIESCQNATKHLNKYYSKKNGIEVETVLCIPKNDPLLTICLSKTLLFQGSEEDVLSRYWEMSNEFKSDYIVRITGDCPLIPPFMISKIITAGVQSGYDYLSNVDERVRTSPDGMDCEFFSKSLLDRTHKLATKKYDREHVTPFMREEKYGKHGTIVNFLDLSHLKLSLDTQEDLLRMKEEFVKVDKALALARQIFGPSNVMRF